MIMFIILLIGLTTFPYLSDAVKNQPGEKGARLMTIELKSPAFKEGERIPVKFTCDGPDISPALNWSKVPEATKSIALICDDPDAPVGTWVHWVIFNIPASLHELPEALPKDELLPNDAKQGKNDFHRIGYGGPCPPGGPAHRYFFKIYALGIELALKSGVTKKDLVNAMKDHILAEGQLMGKYSR